MSSRVVETYVLVGGQWKYLYRAVDRTGNTIDFLFASVPGPRRRATLLRTGTDLHGFPDKIPIDKSGANVAAVASIRADSGADIELRQNKHLNNIVEQDHRAIKRIVRPMFGSGSRTSAASALSSPASRRSI